MWAREARTPRRAAPWGTDERRAPPGGPAAFGQGAARTPAAGVDRPHCPPRSVTVHPSLRCGRSWLWIGCGAEAAGAVDRKARHASRGT